MRQYLAESVVGKALRRAVRMVDAQHFAVGFAFKPRGLIQGIGDGHQMVALVVAVIRAFARAVLKALDLGEGVPP